MSIQGRSHGQLLLHGIVGGIIAGLVFAVADMVMAVAVMDAPFYAPLLMIGAIVLGPQTMDPGYPVAQAAAAAIPLHMMMSALYGVVFVYLLALLRQLSASTPVLLVLGSIFGLALWVVNFLIIAPIAFPWFAMVDQFWLGFVAHTFFFGTVIGAYVAATRPAGVTATR
jgi:hypothetical protein